MDNERDGAHAEVALVTHSDPRASAFLVRVTHIFGLGFLKMGL